MINHDVAYKMCLTTKQLIFLLYVTFQNDLQKCNAFILGFLFRVEQYVIIPQHPASLSTSPSPSIFINIIPPIQATSTCNGPRIASSLCALDMFFMPRHSFKKIDFEQTWKERVFRMKG